MSPAALPGKASRAIQRFAGRGGVVKNCFSVAILLSGRLNSTGDQGVVPETNKQESRLFLKYRPFGLFTGKRNALRHTPIHNPRWLSRAKRFPASSVSLLGLLRSPTHTDYAGSGGEAE
jgi:hypothetical protein